MLVKKVTFNDFLKEFEDHGRGDQFSHEGKRALYNYLNQLAEDLKEPIQLDVIALCCQFSEFKNLEDFKKDYGIDDIESLEDLEYYTTLIKIDNERFIIEDF